MRVILGKPKNLKQSDSLLKTRGGDGFNFCLRVYFLLEGILS